MAQFICIAALTGFAFRVGNDELDDRLAGQRGSCLLPAVASFSIGNPTDALAVMGVVLISVHWRSAGVPTMRRANGIRGRKPTPDVRTPMGLG